MVGSRKIHPRTVAGRIIQKKSVIDRVRLFVNEYPIGGRRLYRAELEPLPIAREKHIPSAIPDSIGRFVVSAEKSIHRQTSRSPGPVQIPLRPASINVRGTFINVNAFRKAWRQ